MKIAIIHNQFSRGGGMEAYMLALVKGFLTEGDTVDIYTYEVDRRLAASLPCTIHEMKLPLLPRRWQKYSFLHKCHTQFNRNDYDLSLSLTRTDCQDISVCGGVHPAMMERVRRTSLFHRLHDSIEIAFEKKMVASVPIIMAHSQSIAREIRHYYGRDIRTMKVLYPPIDTDIFMPSDPQTIKKTRAKLNISADKISFLFPSSGHTRKGFSELLQAFRQLDPDRFELLVAGGTLPRKIPAIVRHIGYIDNLAPIYSAVNYTILPSHYEPFGLVIPESLQCGTPVITTKEVGAAELLSQHDGIIMKNNHPETLIATIRNLDTTLSVAPDFAGRHRLTITQHIADIKALSPSLRSR